MSVSVRTHMWLWWGLIATEHEAEAREARAKRDLLRESLAAMVVISACAHALDALYGAVKELLPPKEPASKRATEIVETLKRAFVVPGRAGAGRWAADFVWLFDLRDAAVHFKESSNPTAPHPIGTHTGRENVIYSLEPARRAVDLLVEVLDLCTSTARPEQPLVVAWTRGMRDAFECIEQDRASRQ